MRDLDIKLCVLDLGLKSRIESSVLVYIVVYTVLILVLFEVLSSQYNSHDHALYSKVTKQNARILLPVTTIAVLHVPCVGIALLLTV